MEIEVFSAESNDKITKFIKENESEVRLINRPDEFLSELEVNYVTVNYDIDPSSLELELPSDKESDQNKTDQVNSVKVCEAFNKLTPAQATDERLWATLSMRNYHEYSNKRWGYVKEDKWNNAILQHFVCTSTVRSLHRNNSISRLWWMGYALHQSQGLDINKAAEILFNNSDYRSNVYERPGSTRYDNVRAAILRITEEHMAANNAKYNVESFRNFMKEVNFLSGRSLLGVLDDHQLIDLLKPIYEKCHAP